MKFYSETDKGNVKATMVLAVPRSVSTMLGKSLSMSPDIGLYLFQPFYTTQDSGQEVDSYITKAIADKSATPDNPLNVVMKVMAESVTGQRFHHLKNHCDNVVVLLRDPQAQALSTFRAWYEKKSGKAIQESEKSELKAWRSLKGFDEYIVTPWERIEQHMHQLDSQPDGQGPKWCVADGDTIRAMPEKMLKRLTDGFGLAYSPNMISGWGSQEDKTVNMNGGKYQVNGSWLGRAKHTTEIKKPTAMTPALEDFSKPVRRQVISNLKTYVRMMSNSHAMMPKPAELEQMIRKEDFANTCPVACYTMVSLWPDEIAAKRDKLLIQMRDEQAVYISSFFIIDSVINREMPKRWASQSTQHRSGESAGR